MKKLIFIGLVFLISCKKESKEDHISSFPVEVQKNVRNFLQEGKDRGVSLDIRKIHNIYLQDNITLSKSGKAINAAAYYYHPDKSIYIDTTSFDYKNPNVREVMIFHELGHGLLHREHRSDLLLNGSMCSIMNADSLPVISSRFAFRREYYLDELFLIAVDEPYWSK